MAQELKELLAKIQEEGVNAAQAKARTIEEEAKRQAQAIIAAAKNEAAVLLRDAAQRIQRDEKSARASLQQAGRDMVLSLRAQIMAMLEKIVLGRVREALKPEELGRIIVAMAKEVKHKEAVTVTLRPEDAQKLEKEFLGELKKQVEGGIVLRPAQDIQGGLVISFDQGRSAFDFTDKALSDYICQNLKSKLADILTDAPPK
jgi:V/A-type H+-transporting ATPase subunit E